MSLFKRNKESDDTKLKSCPFCGGEKVQFLLEIDLGIRTSHGINGEFIRCLCCGAMIGKYANMDVVEAQNKAIAAWNRRLISNLFVKSYL